ncbi:hypothetical protein WA158_006758 [Blastocystis sp. Blastoise]
MSDTEFHFTDDKYLFTFQDETKLWISKEFVEKYQQLPFYDIIKHSEKYEDGSYYIDMLPFHIEKVISFLMDETMDISSLNLRDSYDIYKIFVDYPVTIDNEIQSDLLFHVKELFIEYLKKSSLDIYGYYIKDSQSYIPMELFNSNRKKMCLKDDYSSNIPLEYICPKCIQDIFPSLETLIITVITHYKKSELLLNPNSDEYIMEYIRLFNENDYKIDDSEKYEYFSESDMKEYNKISSLNLNNSHYSHNSINSYNGKRQKSKLPKLYEYLINEAIYTNDISKLEINETAGEYILKDQVSIEYDGIDSKYESIIIINAFLEDVFDSLTILNVNWIRELTNEIDYNLFYKIMTTHVFPNVTELIYDDKTFKLSLINKECFPKLHIINYEILITTENFKSLFPANLISMIDTIRINSIDYNDKEKIALLFDDLIYTHSIYIDIINIDIYDLAYYFPYLKELLTKNFISVDNLSIYSSDFKCVEMIDYFENNKQNIDKLDIAFIDDDHDEVDKRNSLERFLKSDTLEHLNELEISFDDAISIEYLTWISTLFDDNKFNTIKELTINLESIEEDSSFDYLTLYENLVEKIILKASSVNIDYCTMAFINRLIPKGCFHNTTRLILRIDDIPDDNFCKLYTTDNFPKLKFINICIFINNNNNNILYNKSYKCENREWWSSFITIICNYINNNNFPSSTIIRLSDMTDDVNYIYNPNTSIFRCKYDSNSLMNTIICTKDKVISEYEIETLFDYIYDEEQLSKLINFLTIGKIPKLKELIFDFCCNISDEQIEIYKQQLKDSPFIQENKVAYKLIKEN